MKIRHTLLASAVAVSGFAMAPQASAGSDAFIGEIMDVGFNFCPRGWAQTNGQLLAISQNSALFSLLGTTYGGDGRTTFGLPDLRGRSMVNVGTGPGLSSYSWGQRTGQETVTLNTTQIPSHNHPHSHGAGIRTVTDAPNSMTPFGSAFTNLATNAYHDGTVPGAPGKSPRFMDPGTVFVQESGGPLVGGNQSHENRAPSLAVYRCIALVGIFPSRN